MPLFEIKIIKTESTELVFSVEAETEDDASEKASEVINLLEDGRDLTVHDLGLEADLNERLEFENPEVSYDLSEVVEMD